MPPEQLPEQPQISVPEAPVAPPPQKTKDKFKLFSAIRPALRAIKQNVALLGLGVLASLILTILQLLINPNNYRQSLTNYGQQQFEWWSLLVYIPSIIVGIFISIFTTLVIADGAHQERERFGAYVRMVFKRYWRVLFSYILAGLSILLPVASGIIIIAAFGAVASLSNNRLLDIFVALLAVVGGISIYIWFLATLIRYSLVGYVAIFDLTIPARHTMRRSRQLLEGTGEWFVVKLGLLGLLIYFPIFLAPLILAINPSSIAFLQAAFIFTTFLSIPYGVFTTAMLVILYLNRQTTKPAPDIQPKKSSWKVRAFIGLTIIGIFVLALSAPSLIRRNNLQRQQKQEQQAAQQKASIENNLAVYTNKDQGYALKLPKDFVLTTSNPTEGDVFMASKGQTPFIVVIKPLPKELQFVYSSDQATYEAVDSELGAFDSYLQYSTGTTDTTTVSGVIKIPGTRHKRGIFSTVGTPNVAGEEINMKIIIIPKDDGTGLMANITYLKQASSQLEPVIDVIFKSIDLSSQTGR